MSVMGMLIVGAVKLILVNNQCKGYCPGDNADLNETVFEEYLGGTATLCVGGDKLKS